MPVIEVKVMGKLSEGQKKEIAKNFTDTMEKVAGKPKDYTYIIFTEVSPTHWAHKGELFG